MVDSDTATANKWSVGTKLSTTFPDGTRKAFTVAGIYGKTIFVQGLQANLDEASKAAASRASRTRSSPSRRAPTRRLSGRGSRRSRPSNPLLAVQNTEDLKDQIGGFINQLLYVVYGLLILSIIIAVLGVINTMAMAVLERTREIGLLRAIRPHPAAVPPDDPARVGAHRAAGGAARRRHGLLVGVALQRSTKESVGIDKLAVPYTSIVIFFVLAAVVGVISALSAGPAGLADGRAGGDRHRVRLLALRRLHGRRRRASTPHPRCGRCQVTYRRGAASNSARSSAASSSPGFASSHSRSLCYCAAH